MESGRAYLATKDSSGKVHPINRTPRDNELLSHNNNVHSVPHNRTALEGAVAMGENNTSEDLSPLDEPHYLVL